MENVRGYGFCLSKDRHWRVAPEDRCAESVPVSGRPGRAVCQAGQREDRGEVEKLARTVQAVIGDSVEIAWVDRGLPASVPHRPAHHSVDERCMEIEGRLVARDTVLTEPLEHGADVLMLVFDRTTRAIDDHLQEAIVLGLA